MVEHGHSWSAIQSYTLSQVGIFSREAMKLDDRKRKELITSSWLGANVDQKGLKKILNDAVNRSRPSSVSDPEDQKTIHKKNWNALAARMAGMR